MSEHMTELENTATTTIRGGVNMLTDAKGAEAIIALQAKIGIVEPRERAQHYWRKFTKDQKKNTEAAHRALCGGFEEED